MGSPHISVVLIVLVCLINTQGTTSVITVSLEISSELGSDRDCPGGDVGLTNTSILVHYRLYGDESLPEEWQFLASIDIRDNSRRELDINSNVSSLQLRLLQMEHGGPGCNCWEVRRLRLSSIDGNMATSPITLDDIRRIRCNSKGLNNGGRFCLLSAYEVRGVVTGVINLRSTNGMNDIACPGNSSDFLIAPKGPALLENCSTTTPRM